MNEQESVAQFHEGGATVAAMLAFYELSARALDALVPDGGRLLDLGVGTGRALHRFLARRPDVIATAIDLAPNMLATARRFFDIEGISDQVSFVEADLTALPDEVTAETWDAVSCVWTLHHLPELSVLRGALRQIAQIRDKDGSAVWLLDFQRMKDPKSWPNAVAAVQPDMPPMLRTDGLASEAAAFTHDELRTELAEAGLGDLESGIARPIPFLQAHWSRSRRSHDASASKRDRVEPLRGQARLDAMLLLRGFSRLPS